MRLALVLLLAQLGAGPVAVAAAPARLPHFQLYGWEFVDMQAWAAANGLQVGWDKAAGTIALTNRSTRLGFTVDSRRAEVNGVNAWLSVPITPYNQTVCLAVLDAQTLVRPLLEPARNPRGQIVRTIALDPGHGGKDPGNQANDELEKHHALLLAQAVRDLLKDAGLKVVLTRSADRFVDLGDRDLIARRQKADLFISLHYNASQAGNGVKGLETYCLTPAGAQSTNARGEEGLARPRAGNAFNAKNALLAYQLQAALTRNLDCEDRGLKRGRFVVLCNPGMPAALIEAGFMSDPAEAKEIFDADHRQELAKAIVDGILAYKRLVER